LGISLCGATLTAQNCYTNNFEHNYVQPMTLNEYSGALLTIDMSFRSIRIKPYQLRKSL